MWHNPTTTITAPPKTTSNSLTESIRSTSTTGGQTYSRGQFIGPIMTNWPFFVLIRGSSAILQATSFYSDSVHYRRLLVVPYTALSGHLKPSTKRRDWREEIKQLGEPHSACRLYVTDFFVRLPVYYFKKKDCQQASTVVTVLTIICVSLVKKKVLLYARRFQSCPSDHIRFSNMSTVLKSYTSLAYKNQYLLFRLF